ncbi:MAG: hypothetical protein WC313_05505 [Candidatus Kapaibacterium sp.]|jgi:hypothetical protein|nr:hypothetical protein [Candidatus Kapabacteria bacterium]
MLFEILSKHDLSKNLVSDWHPCVMDRMQKGAEPLYAESLLIVWENVVVAGSSPPHVRIECSIDGIYPTFLKDIALEGNSNITDSLLLVFSFNFQFVRINVFAEDTTGGELYVSMKYR